jgi:hypothetical protein
MSEINERESHGTSDGGGVKRWFRTLAGVMVALAGAILFVLIFYGFRDWLDAQRLSLVFLFALRFLSFAAIAWGCWYAYRHWRRI